MRSLAFQNYKQEVICMKKKLIGLFLAALLALAMLAIVSAYEMSATDCRIIRETVISAADGLPFVAEFNPDTETISSFRGEECFGVRYNQTEEDFWRVVEINRMVTNPGRSAVNRNVTRFNHESGTIYVYDFYGNKTVIVISAEDLEYYGTVCEWYFTRQEQRFEEEMRLARLEREESIDIPIAPLSIEELFWGNVFVPSSLTPNLLVGPRHRETRGWLRIVVGNAPQPVLFHLLFT
jgi:hypothetical protein